MSQKSCTSHPMLFISHSSQLQSSYDVYQSLRSASVIMTNASVISPCKQHRSFLVSQKKEITSYRPPDGPTNGTTEPQSSDKERPCEIYCWN